MTRIEGDRGADLDARLETLEARVLSAAQQAAQARRELRDAQRSAADSMQKSAESQDRIAQVYEEVAAYSGRRDEYLEHAARHREFAKEDYLMAQQLRQMAEAELTDNPGPLLEPDRRD